MHYELSDYEWAAIKPMLQAAWLSARKRRRVLDGIFWCCGREHPGATCQRPMVLTAHGTIASETHCRWQRSRGSHHMDHAFLVLTASGIALLLVSCAAALALH